MSFTERLKSAVRNVKDFPSPGILFKDITPVLHDPKLCYEVLQEFVKSFPDEKPDAIISIESRGFMWGMMLAQHYNVPFIPVRKAGKLPYKTIKQAYSLEYGTASMEIHVDAIKPGWKVLVHDDLLATGGTAAAASNLVKRSGGEVMGFCFLIELSFLNGRDKLSGFNEKVISLAIY